MSYEFKMRRTEAALLTRGVDSVVAARLANEKWTVSKLKTKSLNELLTLGLQVDAAKNLRGEGRPPIPSSTLTSLLFKNKFQCCVCRDTMKGITVHHIDPWAKSRDHTESNLSVLCPDHHDKAHTVSTLTKNLDPNTLRAFKNEWEDRCAQTDAEAIVQASRLFHSAWLYFNHMRLIAVARDLNANFQRTTNFKALHKEGVVSELGYPTEKLDSLSYMYNTASGIALYQHFTSILQFVIKRLTIWNISDYLDRSILLSAITAGDFVFVQGAHTFASQAKKWRGRGDVVHGSRRANGVEVNFVFDRWEATSCSAWTTWLSGRRAVGSLVHVKSAERIENCLILSGTVLAISNGHDSLKRRDYAPGCDWPVLREEMAEEDGSGDTGIRSDFVSPLNRSL